MPLQLIEGSSANILLKDQIFELIVKKLNDFCIKFTENREATINKTPSLAANIKDLLILWVLAPKGESPRKNLTIKFKLAQNKFVKCTDDLLTTCKSTQKPYAQLHPLIRNNEIDLAKKIIAEQINPILETLLDNVINLSESAKELSSALADLCSYKAPIHKLYIASMKFLSLVSGEEAEAFIPYANSLTELKEIILPLIVCHQLTNFADVHQPENNEVFLKEAEELKEYILELQQLSSLIKVTTDPIQVKPLLEHFIGEFIDKLLEQDIEVSDFRSTKKASRGCVIS